MGQALRPPPSSSSKFGPGQHAVAADVGDAAGGAPRDRARRRPRGCGRMPRSSRRWRPSARRRSMRTSSASVIRSPPNSSKKARTVSGCVDGEAADHDPADAGVEHVARSARASRKPPATWSFSGAVAGEAGDQLVLARARRRGRRRGRRHGPIARPPRRSGRAPRPDRRDRRSHRRSAPARGARSGRPSGPWRDRGSSLEQGLAGSARPASPERSGWNCAPSQLPLRTAAGIVAAIVGARHRLPGPSIAGEAVGEIDIVAGARGRCSSSRTSSRLQPMCGTGRPGAGLEPAGPGRR